MKSAILVLSMGLLAAFFSASVAGAHCEIPCGIYDDQLRINLVAEHATTIEKSMKEIVELGKADQTNHNQLVRWVSNKEHHATEVQNIVSQYFMIQRIKPDQDKYAEKLSVLHKMLIAAMQCKQTTDLSHVNTLRSLLKAFESLYFDQ